MTLTPLEVVFPEGTQSNSDPRCITISTVDDDDYEENHQFSVELRVISNDSIITPGSPSLITIAIQDNTGRLPNQIGGHFNTAEPITMHYVDAVVQFASSELEVNESIGNIELCLVAEISGIFETALTVILNTNDGTASKV